MTTRVSKFLQILQKEAFSLLMKGFLIHSFKVEGFSNDSSQSQKQRLKNTIKTGQMSDSEVSKKACYMHTLHCVRLRHQKLINYIQNQKIWELYHIKYVHACQVFLKSLTCLAFDTLKVTLQLPNPYLISQLIYFTARIALQFVDNINMDMCVDYISSCI